MIKVLLDQYYRCRPGLPPWQINLCIQQNAGQTAFGTEKGPPHLLRLKTFFSDQLTRYPALNSLKSAALPESEG